MPTLNLGKVRLSFEGEWTAGQNYEAMSLITHNSEAFMSVAEVPPSTVPPAEDPDQWVKVGSKGDTGPKGDKGSTGPQGPQGPQGNTGPSVSLSSSISSTDTSVAANSYAVKQAYDKGNAAAAVVQPCITNNVFTAPMPSNTAGALGNWKLVCAFALNTAAVLPAGGTWAYFTIQWNTVAKVIASTLAGTASGGKVIAVASSTFSYACFCWRVY